MKTKHKKFIIFASIITFLVAFLVIFVRFYGFFKAIWTNLPIFKAKKESDEDIFNKEYSKIGPRSDFQDSNEHLDADEFENLTTEEKSDYFEQTTHDFIGKWVRIDDFHSLYFGKMGQITDRVWENDEIKPKFRVKFPDLACKPIFKDEQFDFIEVEED